MKAAVISLGSKSSQWIAEAMGKYFREVDTVQLKDLYVELTSRGTTIHSKKGELPHYDCVYQRGSFRYRTLLEAVTSSLWEHAYMPLGPRSFTIGHDKFLTHLALMKHKVPQPRTYILPTIVSAKKLLKEVNYPIIMKFPHGTQGKGVMFADSLPSAKSVVDTLEAFNQPFIIQQYIETGATDVRAIVVGRKVIAAMRRKASAQELRANIHMGGEGESYELDPETEAMAVRAAAAVGAEVCGIDILEGLRGKKNVVLEVNASPGLKGVTAATKKDIHGAIVKFLEEKTKGFNHTKSNSDFNNIIESINPEVNENKEIITNIDIKLGMIKLPQVVTKLSGFKTGEEVLVEAEKGRIEVKKC